MKYIIVSFLVFSVSFLAMATGSFVETEFQDLMPGKSVFNQNGISITARDGLQVKNSSRNKGVYEQSKSEKKFKLSISGDNTLELTEKTLNDGDKAIVSSLVRGKKTSTLLFGKDVYKQTVSLVSKDKKLTYIESCEKQKTGFKCMAVSAPLCNYLEQNKIDGKSMMAQLIESKSCIQNLKAIEAKFDKISLSSQGKAHLKMTKEVPIKAFGHRQAFKKSFNKNSNQVAIEYRSLRKIPNIKLDNMSQWATQCEKLLAINTEKEQIIFSSLSADARAKVRRRGNK